MGDPLFTDDQLVQWLHLKYERHGEIEDREAGMRLRALSTEVTELRALLTEAIETIKVFHGPDAWDIYYNNAPEMKRFRGAVSGREES